MEITQKAEIIEQYAILTGQNNLARAAHELLFDLKERRAEGLVDLTVGNGARMTVSLAREINQTVGRSLDDGTKIWQLRYWEEASTPQRWTEVIKSLDSGQRRVIMQAIERFYNGYSWDTFNREGEFRRWYPNYTEYKDSIDLGLLRSKSVDDLMRVNKIGLASSIFLHTAFNTQVN